MAEEMKQPETEPAENPENQPEQPVKTYSEQEYQALAEQLTKANQTIQDFEKMDIENIKKSVEEYKQKWEQSEQERKAFEHRTRIAGFVRNLGLKNDVYEKHVTDMILEKDLKFDGDKLIGGDDIVNAFKANYPDAFQSAKPVPEFSVPTSGTSGVRDDDAFVRAVMGLK